MKPVQEENTQMALNQDYGSLGETVLARQLRTAEDHRLNPRSQKHQPRWLLHVHTGTRLYQEGWAC